MVARRIMPVIFNVILQGITNSPKDIPARLAQPAEEEFDEPSGRVFQALDIN